MLHKKNKFTVMFMVFSVMTLFQTTNSADELDYSIYSLTDISQHNLSILGNIDPLKNNQDLSLEKKVETIKTIEYEYRLLREKINNYFNRNDGHVESYDVNILNTTIEANYSLLKRISIAPDLYDFPQTNLEDISLIYPENEQQKICLIHKLCIPEKQNLTDDEKVKAFFIYLQSKFTEFHQP